MEDLYIGSVAHSEPGWSRLQPLAKVEQGHWRTLENLSDVFPPSGRVFALPRAISSPKVGSLWVFTREQNSRPDASKDKFIVDVAAPAIAIVDMSSISIEQARQRLFDVGIGSQELAGRDAVVLLAGGMFCVVQFEQPIRGVRKALPSPDPLSVMIAPTDWRESDRVAGRAYLPSMQVPLCPVARSVNWCSDADFVSKILSRARKYAQQLGDTKYAGPTREGVQYIARALEQVELFPGSPADIELDLERFKAQWPGLQAKLGAADELRSMLMESSAARQQLAQATLETRAAEAARLKPLLEAEVRSQILAELADKVREQDEVSRALALMNAQCAQATQELNRVRDEVASARAELSKARADADAFARRLRDSFERLPAQEMVVTRMLAEQLEFAISARSPLGLLPATSAPWSSQSPNIGDGAREITAEDLLARFDSVASWYAVDRDSLVAMHAFAVAGELVLLTGPNAERALSAYASCVAGARLSLMPLDPSAIGLDDLWRVPGGLAPTALAFAWNRALSDPGMPVIVCLSNLDAAPFHLWLHSLSQYLRSQGRPGNLLLFATTSTPHEAASVAYPLCEEIKACLVPIQPDCAEGSPLQILGSFASPTKEATRIRLGELDVVAATKAESFAMRITEIATDPEAVVRAARLIAAWPKGASDETPWDWIKSLSGAASDELAVCLRSGSAALTRLHYQR